MLDGLFTFDLEYYARTMQKEMIYSFNWVDNLIRHLETNLKNNNYLDDYL